MNWRLLLTPPAIGVRNMALDEALLRRAAVSGEGVVRVYSWNRPTISFGRNQSARRGYDAALAADAGLDVVRRITGGRALVHHREITYSVSAPIAEGESLRASYSQTNQLLLNALTMLGVAATIEPRGGRSMRPSSAACFELPAEGELTANGRKLAGSAQVREEGAWLQHGSLLVHDDQHLLTRASHNGAVPIAQAATLFEAAGREITPPEFAAMLFQAVRDDWDQRATELELDDALEQSTRELESHYLSQEWTWRA